jgi:hypothetical protein
MLTQMFVLQNCVELHWHRLLTLHTRPFKPSHEFAWVQIPLIDTSGSHLLLEILKNCIDVHEQIAPLHVVP